MFGGVAGTWMCETEVHTGFGADDKAQRGRHFELSSMETLMSLERCGGTSEIVENTILCAGNKSQIPRCFWVL